MKTYINCFCFLLIIAGISACEDLVFIPVKGSIQGVVTDNNGRPLQGVNVSAVYEEPSEQPFETTKSAITDDEGYYQITDVWDDVVLNYNKTGHRPGSTLLHLADNHKPVANIVLEGSPTITSIRISKPSLNAGAQDSLSIVVEVQDKFNENIEGYFANLILQMEDGSTQSIRSMLLKEQGFEIILFEDIISSEDLTYGTYQAIAEVHDPDGNQSQLEGGYIKVE